MIRSSVQPSYVPYVCAYKGQAPEIRHRAIDVSPQRRLIEWGSISALE